MQHSKLQNKSELMVESAKLLHEKCLYPCVAHATYYSCYQLMKHIWLYTMNKSEQELDSNMSQSRTGSHEYLLNKIVNYIGSMQSHNAYKDSRDLRNTLPLLKKLRTKADYSDNDFDSSGSNKSIILSEKLLPILKRY